jgi:hypothetical protein
MSQQRKKLLKCAAAKVMPAFELPKLKAPDNEE